MKLKNKYEILNRNHQQQQLYKFVDFQQQLSLSYYNSLPLIDLADTVVRKMKFPNDYKYKFESWMSYKSQFEKSKLMKEQKQQMIEKQQKYSQVEYTDEKFLKRFLQINKIWLRLNVKSMFEDLMKGSAVHQLPNFKLVNLNQKIYKHTILKRLYLFFDIPSHLLYSNLQKPFQFYYQIIDQRNQIYGELKNQSNTQDIEVQPVKIGTSAKTQVAQNIGSSLISMLKYWKQRSQVLSIAQKCIAGYLLKGQKSCCFYCKRNWGLMLQTKESIEDTFNEFYKQECKKLQGYFNVQMIFEQNILILDSKSYNKEIILDDIEEDISEFEEEDNFKSSQNSEGDDYYNNIQEMDEQSSNEDNHDSDDENKKFLKSMENSLSPKKRSITSQYSISQDSFESEDSDSSSSESSTSSYGSDQKKRKNKKKPIKQSIKQNQKRKSNFKQTQSIFVTQLSGVKNKYTINKQKFVEKWQEHFFLNSTFVTICFECNDEAQDQFLSIIQKQREQMRQYNELSKYNINLKRSQSSYNVQ